MAWPIVISTNGYGTPVTESALAGATPIEIAENGYGTPVVFVDKGGLPVTYAVPPEFSGFDLGWDFVNGRLYCGAVYPTDTHPSPILMPDASGAWVGKAANVLCREQGVGMQTVPSYQQFAANPQAPANQTVTLSATGTYTLWIEGPGSVAAAAGTAVGTGFGSASTGVPVTFTLSAGGTVNLTVTGAPTLVQVINKGFVLPPIYSAATVTGNQQVVDLTGRLGSGVAGWVKVYIKDPGSGSIRFVSFTASGNGNEQIRIGHNAGSMNFVVASGGVPTVDITLGPWTQGVQTIAFAASGSFAKARIVGGADTTARTTVAYPSTINLFGIGGFGTTHANNVYGLSKAASLRFGPVDATVFADVYAKAVLAAA